MKKGFTLLELLIVISIIGILSGISFSAMKSGGKSLALSRATHSLATEIRKAQEMAMAMKKITQNPQGYGIYIKKNPVRIYLFADTSSPYDRYNLRDTIVEDFCQSEKDICQGKINIVSFSPSANELHIVFKPPHPTTVFYPSSSEVSITLGVDSLTKTIRVFKTGLISVE